jgi:hypothetical protein
MMDFPAYTRKKDEVKKNNGDFVVPAGTEITWKFSTQNTDHILMNFEKDHLKLVQKSPYSFEYEKTVFQSESYSIKTSNQFIENSDSLTYTIASSRMPFLRYLLKSLGFRIR